MTSTLDGTGTVVAVGPGARDQQGAIIPPSVQEGDKVLLPAYGGTELKLGEDEYHIFRDSEIMGKFED